VNEVVSRAPKKDERHHFLQPKYFVEIYIMAMCSFVLNSFFLFLAGDHDCSLNGARMIDPKKNHCKYFVLRSEYSIQSEPVIINEES
jgi:hypothetical protein